MALVVQPLLLFDFNRILVFASFLSGLFSGALSLEIFYPQSTCIQTQWSNQDTTETLSCQKKEPHPSSNYGDNRFASTLPDRYHWPPRLLENDSAKSGLPVMQFTTWWAANGEPPSQSTSHAVHHLGRPITIHHPSQPVMQNSLLSRESSPASVDLPSKLWCSLVTVWLV